MCVNINKNAPAKYFKVALHIIQLFLLLINLKLMINFILTKLITEWLECVDFGGKLLSMNTCGTLLI